MWRSIISLSLVAIFLGGCSTTRQTHPARSANEELLISTAVHRAVAKIHPTVPKGTKIYLSARHFSADYDTKYAIGAIQTQLLRDGYRLVSRKSDASTVAAIRSGALSINKESQLWLGIPSITLPVPFSGPLNTPALNLLKRTKRTGVAELGLTFYDAHSGKLQDYVAPIYGYSHLNRWTVLMVSWINTNLPNQPAH